MPAAWTSGRGVRASGQQLPFADNSFDICLSSNVVEHTSAPWAMCEEMLRVTRPGGTVIVSYTLWYGPVRRSRDGSDTLRRRAPRRALVHRHHGHPPKNLYGTSLFKVTAAEGSPGRDRWPVPPTPPWPSPVPAVVAVADHAGTGAAGGAGHQSRSGPA